MGDITVEVPAACTAEEGEMLRKAGFVPVIRWVRREGGPTSVPKSDVAIKTIDALTVLERERGVRPTAASFEEASKPKAIEKKNGKSKPPPSGRKR